MKNYVQPGNTITLTAPYAVTSGRRPARRLHLRRGRRGCRHRRNRSRAALVGVFDLNKVGSQAWSVGDKVYWDNTNKEATKTATANTLIGVADRSCCGRRGRH